MLLYQRTLSCTPSRRYRSRRFVQQPNNTCWELSTTSSLIQSGPVGSTTGSLTGQYSSNSAFYYPWVQAPDPLFGNRPTLFPPCGFVAGIYAATDATRNVWKAPAGINASLTGHLVFSTLHTNDAPSAVARLVDIGVPPFLVSSSVRAIVAQRLVRRLCPKCKQPHQLSEGEVSALRVDASQLRDTAVMRPVGCEACRHLGYKGRMGIFELFIIDDEVRYMVNEKASTITLRKRARELGMRTLREDGVRKVLSGMTSAEEVISTTMGDSD